MKQNPAFLAACQGHFSIDYEANELKYATKFKFTEFRFTYRHGFYNRSSRWETSFSFQVDARINGNLFQV